MGNFFKDLVDKGKDFLVNPIVGATNLVTDYGSDAINDVTGGLIDKLTGADQIQAAADAQAAAADAATQVQWNMYTQNREDWAPWREEGEKALNTLVGMVEAGPGDYEKSPGYQYRLDEGNKNILARASATGRYNSGATDKALLEYGQDYATNDYDNFLARYYQSLTPYQSLAGLGQTATSQTTADATSTANAVSNLITEEGEARASGYINQLNANQNLFQTGLMALGIIL